MKIGTSGTTPDGGFIDHNCTVHLSVESVKDLGGKIEVKSNVLASSDPTQVGRTSTEFLHYTGAPGAIKRLFVWACAVGIYSEERWKEDEKNGVEADIEPADAEGMEFCGEIQMKPGQGEKANQLFANLDYRMWGVADPRAVNIPKDATSPLMKRLAELGKLPKQGPVTPPAGGSGAGKPPGTNGNGSGSSKSGGKKADKEPAGAVDPDQF